MDTANVDEIKRIYRLGIVNGVTTNPRLVAKEVRLFKEVILEICSIVEGPVSTEVIDLIVEGMFKEAYELANWAPNVVVKIPMTENGIEAVHRLSKEGIKTNVTLVFNCFTGFDCCKSWSDIYQSFCWKVDDIGIPGLDLIKDLKSIMNNYQFETNYHG